MPDLKPTRADTWRIVLRVEHPTNPGSMINYGVWDNKTGGQVDSEERLYHPGGMEPPISLGGHVTVENITLRRLYRLGRDHEAIGQLIDSVGKCRAEISQQPMTLRGVTSGRPIVYTGTFKRVQIPEHDSESNDPAMVEIEVTADVPPTT